MEQYLIDVSEILSEIGVSVPMDGEYQLDVLTVGTESFPLREPVRVTGDVTNAGAGLIARGHAVAPVRATCVRCLNEFDLDIDGTIEVLYLGPGDTAPEDEDLESVDPQGRIDLAPAIMAALVLETPFAPLHDESCKGICSQCGTDLNEGVCACDKDVDDDHPFAALKTLLDEESTSTE